MKRLRGSHILRILWAGRPPFERIRLFLAKMSKLFLRIIHQTFYARGRLLLGRKLMWRLVLRVGFRGVLSVLLGFLVIDLINSVLSGAKELLWLYSAWIAVEHVAEAVLTLKYQIPLANFAFRIATLRQFHAVRFGCKLVIFKVSLSKGVLIIGVFGRLVESLLLLE